MSQSQADPGQAPRPRHPARLFVEPTTRCNLSCAMCVKQARGSALVEGDMPPEVFARLLPALAQAQDLVLTGIGEPLLHPGLEEFIGRAKEVMPPGSWVGLQTNGQLLTSERAHALARVGLDKACLSLDAVSPALLGNLRQGASLEQMEAAMAALCGARQSRGGGPRMGIQFVVMRQNLGELPAVLGWAGRQGVDFALVSHLLPYDSSLVGQAMYGPSVDRALALFGHWQGLARAQGIDLDRDYLQRASHFLTADPAHPVLALVKGLYRQASGQDIPIDLGALLKHDWSADQRVAEAFDQARQAAAQAGLELSLPSPQPRWERRCEFMDTPSAFISWDGGVHPCHFLWHGYEFYWGGRKRTVQPLPMGRLTHGDLGEIWSAPAFRSFRRQARLYDYPYCPSCCLAPCCYLDSPDGQFESDCYTYEVPCGDCPWCHGLLQCLR